MNKITAKTTEEFRDQFKCFLQQEECKKTTSIVYFWMVENPIPRILGENRILYIGRTSRSLNKRYSGGKAFEIEVKYFEQIYKRVIETYGSISIDAIATENPKSKEWEELNAYYCNHLEHPPLNRSIPGAPVSPMPPA